MDKDYLHRNISSVRSVKTTFAVGHLSIGYLTAKASAKLLKQKVNLPLIFALSLIPDIDIIIPGLIHRTLTHSIIISTIIFIPIFIYYRTKATPYFIALTQHSLIGDFITSGAYNEGPQLLWPLTSASYGLPISILSTTNILIEWTNFLIATAIMLKTKDLTKLLQSNKTHLYLTIPLLPVILPSFFHFPLIVPPQLIIPHIAYLLLFTAAIANTLKNHRKKP